MKTLKYLVLTFTFLFFSSIVTTTLFAESDEHNKPYHWSYEGECGPEHWGDLIHKNCKCKLGDMQSPIGISVTEKAKLDSINFHYYATPLKIINNGHTMQINYGCGSSIFIGNKKYELMQFHFHCPSEHKIHGKSYDMEVHLVHKGEHGELAVVAVFMEEGKENDFIRTLWSNFPKEQGKEYVVNVRINANELLPKDIASYYTYHGSLTTPPCSEIVNWFVLKTPIQISKIELEKFASIFKRDARPIQPQHGRIVKESY